MSLSSKSSYDDGKDGYLDMILCRVALIVSMWSDQWFIKVSDLAIYQEIYNTNNLPIYLVKLILYFYLCRHFT